NVGQTIAAVIQRDPVPTTEITGGDPELWAIIRRGLAKERRDRWPDIATLRSALTAWAIASGVTADITGAPLAVTSRSSLAEVRSMNTPLVPGPIPSEGGTEDSTLMEDTIGAPIPVIEPTPREPTPREPTPREPTPQHELAPAPLLATPARRANVTSTPAAARRSPALMVIAVIAVIVLAAILTRRWLQGPASRELMAPASAVAP
ncbi:MAG: hypothetical protein ABI134_34320, partial [Byssovorax sp.]